MSLKDLAHLSGVPGLGPAISLLTATHQNFENIKVYKQQCQDLSSRCVSTLVAIRESSAGLEGTREIEYADEMTTVIRRINRKVTEWASLNLLKSFIQQREIKDGIDSLHRDIDSAMMRFQIQNHMEITRNHLENKAMLERDRRELRELLQNVVKSQDNMLTLGNMQSSGSQDVEQIMESLQKELMEPANLQPNQEQTFRQSLWWLHQKTSKLPPLTDLTGQVTMKSDRAVAKGTFNDIYSGEWLDNEKVALRLPRTIMNNEEVQKRFQREVKIWRKLRHPNVLPLYGVAHIEDELYSVSPWMDNGTAITYVQQYPEVDRLKILTEVAAGLEYLHDSGIVHGDLRGANVLISQSGVAVLADFGLSKFLEDCAQGMTSSPNMNPRWFAPELLLKNESYSTCSDVWSFGMVCLELLTGEQPFCKISRDIAVQRELDHGKIPERPGHLATAQGLTDEMWTMLKKCWEKKPESRPLVAELKEKIMQIRESVQNGVMPPIQKRRSVFSVLRPSTADSKRSVKSLGSAKSSDSISHLSINAGGSGLSNFSSMKNGSRSPEDSYTVTIVDAASSNGSSNRGGSLGRTPIRELPRDDLSGALSPSRSGSYIGASPSINSSGSGVQISAALREAVTDERSIVNIDERTGSVLSGTMEGLVERLINNFNLSKDMEYRDVLLTACIDFTTPEDLLGVLARRFSEVESLHPESRVHIQYNIFMILMYWLTSRRLQIDNQLLWQMRDFCESAVRIKSSATMVDKASDIINLINEKYMKDPIQSPVLSPGRRLPRASDITPQDLAIGLTLLEGDKYSNILPSDYIAHLRRLPISNNVEHAYVTNNRIVLWVKQSVLHYEQVESRAQVLKFFINAAQECRKLRNFASLTAIAIALNSAPIERLRLTKEELAPQLRRRLEELEDVVNPGSNHRGYREALREPGDRGISDSCVPWLPVHLRELNAVLHHNPPVVEVKGQNLINFQRYIRFMDRVKEILHYTPPDLERYRQQGQLAYLESQLRNVQVGESSDEALMKRSLSLEAREAKDRGLKKRELKSLGFDVSKY